MYVYIYIYIYIYIERERERDIDSNNKHKYNNSTNNNCNTSNIINANTTIKHGFTQNGGRFGASYVFVMYHKEWNGAVLPSFQQPTFQQFTQVNDVSAAWSAFHLKHAISMFVSSELLKCRLLK